MTHTLKEHSNRRPKNIIGSRVRVARQDRLTHLTQDQLAGKLAGLGVYIDRVGIAKIEAGTRRVSDFEVLALADALRVDPIWLLKGDLHGS